MALSCIHGNSFGIIRPISSLTLLDDERPSRVGRGLRKTRVFPNTAKNIASKNNQTLCWQRCKWFISHDPLFVLKLEILYAPKNNYLMLILIPTFFFIILHQQCWCSWMSENILEQQRTMNKLIRHESLAFITLGLWLPNAIAIQWDLSFFVTNNHTCFHITGSNNKIKIFHCSIYYVQCNREQHYFPRKYNLMNCLQSTIFEIITVNAWQNN